MAIKEIFKEFYIISDKNFSRSDELLGIGDIVRDILIKDYIVMRLNPELGGSLQYMTTGNCLYIPLVWINLGIKFWVHSGKQVLYSITPPQEDAELDEIESFLYYFTVLSQWWVEEWSNIDSDFFLNTVAKLCKLKTDKFRNYCQETYNIILPAWELRTIKEDIII